MSSAWSFNDRQVLVSQRLEGIPWLTHGFGSRLSEDWPGDYTQLKQIHSDLVVNAGPSTGCIGEGDALITSFAGSLVGVRTADCVPLLIVDPVRRVVAAVHAGWRGTVSNVAAKTVERMRQDFGSAPPDLLAAIGPSIAECCFEVGPEVAGQFGNPHATHLNLVAANSSQLEEAGLQPANIEQALICTMCDADRFHSFRRDRQASGRMVSAIGIRRK